MNLNAIKEKAVATRDSALASLGRLPDGLSVDDFIRAMGNVGSYDDYKVVPLEARRIVDAVSSSVGAEGVRCFLKAVLAHSVFGAVESERFQRLPPLVGAHHSRQLERISDDTSGQQAEWLDIDNDLFQKDLGIATFRLYVAGSQLIDPRCGVPRSYVMKGGLAEAPGRLRTILGLGGFRPYFQIHTHMSMLDTFNEQGWEDCYRGCAELYALYPQVRGMMGGSWFYDPALADISPRLAYLRETPLKHGAHLMYVETGGEAMHNSLSSSPTRRKLYEEGSYTPKSYMLIWGKREQSAWAAGNRQPVAA